MSSDDIEIPQAGAAQYWGTHGIGWIAEDGVLNAQDYTTFHLFWQDTDERRDIERATQHCDDAATHSA